MRQRVRDEGRLVGRNEWDSGGPGAGAGVNNVYVFTKLFFAEDDVGMFGPYQTFFEAADVVGLLSAGEATTSIWVSSEYRTEAEGAVTLFDGLSKAQASALFSR